MKYLCLVYADENVVHSVPDEECVGYDSAIRESGHCVVSEALEPVASAKTVRVREGRTFVTDGPFAETKEQLGGFYMIEAPSLEEALQIAAKIPPARVGSIEVRPIRPIREQVRSARAS
ncbi:MAG TPA: YciI family protein [Thermoanaerobaculia bacterium]|nr:YciI family protein [Thermoanaerobaculia bacterium]